MSQINYSDSKIASILAHACYRPDESETRNALQLFVERAVLPKNTKSYNEREMKEHISKFLFKHNERKVA